MSAQTYQQYPGHHCISQGIWERGSGTSKSDSKEMWCLETPPGCKGQTLRAGSSKTTQPDLLSGTDGKSDPKRGK